MVEVSAANAAQQQQQLAQSGGRKNTTTRIPFTGVGPHTSNVVIGCNLECMIDLKVVALHTRNATYNPKRFPACVLRIREPKATALVFSKGKMQVLGTKSVEDARLASRKFARILQKLGFNVRLTDFKVVNMVGHADCKMLIRLEGLHARFSPIGTSHWEPEIFPGMVFTMYDSDAEASANDKPLKPLLTMLIFAKGKIVMLGARKKGDFDTAIEKIWPTLLEFRQDK